MGLRQLALVGAWTVGVAAVAMLTPELNSTIKHGLITGEGLYDSVLQPAPEIASAELALATAPVWHTTAEQKDTKGQHTIEVWNGNQKNVLSLGEQSFQTKPASSPNPYANQISNAASVGTAANFVSQYIAPQDTSSSPLTRLVSANFSKPNPIWLVRHGEVSSAFVNEINAALSTLPQKYLDALGDQGYRVVMSRQLTDVVPNASHEQVRGYEASTTWNSVYGMFNRSSKRLVMAEVADQSKIGRPGLIPLTDQQRRVGIVRHEFGHAVDQYLGNYSHSDAFLQAYKQGASTLNLNEKQTVSYFLQPGPAGAEETFAELFACIDGHGCDSKQDEILRNHFSALISMVQSKLSQIKS